MTDSPAIRTETLQVRRTALVAMRGPEPGASPPPRELWYIMHGQTMRATAFLESARALDDGTRLVVAPEALNRHYLGALSREAPVGATWMTRDLRDADIADNVAYLDALHASLTARLGGNAPPVTLLGFSQGGATAIRWAARGAVRPARIVIWESSLPPDVDHAAMWERCGRPPLTYVCGTRDQWFTPKVLEAQHGVWEAAGLPFTRVSFEGGHRLDDATLRAGAG